MTGQSSSSSASSSSSSSSGSASSVDYVKVRALLDLCPSVHDLIRWFEAGELKARYECPPPPPPPHHHHHHHHLMNHFLFLFLQVIISPFFAFAVLTLWFAFWHGFVCHFLSYIRPVCLPSFPSYVQSFSFLCCFAFGCLGAVHWILCYIPSCSGCSYPTDHICAYSLEVRFVMIHILRLLPDSSLSFYSFSVFPSLLYLYDHIFFLPVNLPLSCLVLCHFQLIRDLSGDVTQFVLISTPPAKEAQFQKLKVRRLAEQLAQGRGRTERDGLRWILL